MACRSSGGRVRKLAVLRSLDLSECGTVDFSTMLVLPESSGTAQGDMVD